MKRLVFSLVLVSLASMLWAGGDSEESMSSDGPVTIEYYMWEDPTYQNIVKAYNESQDNVVVNVNQIASGDYITKMATLLAAGVSMDAYMQIRPVDMFPHVANGYAAPLNDLIAETGFDIDAIESYMDQISIDDVVYAIPFRGASAYTYFNKKVFEKAGVPTPDVYVKNNEWTWAKFEEVANKLATGDGETYGGIMYIWGNYQTPAANQEGLQFITADGKIDINETVIEDFRRRKRLEANKAIIPMLELKVTKTHYSQAFYNGNAGMLLIGEWFPGFMIKGRDENLTKGFGWNDWGVTRLPCDLPEYTTHGACTFNHVYSRSKKKKAAFDLISWMGGPEGAEVVANNGFLTPMITPKVMKAFEASLPSQADIDAFTEPRVVKAPFFNKYGSKINPLLASIMEEYLSNDWSDAQLEARLMEGLEEIIATTD
ncbi:MAG: hypothetical protein CSA76_05185 [Spirochaetales bacterium]|nr:MAG: hypothetical protein CSA76_05185 [Spirochaetales bacterium]